MTGHGQVPWTPLQVGQAQSRAGRRSSCMPAIVVLAIAAIGMRVSCHLSDTCVHVHVLLPCSLRTHYLRAPPAQERRCACCVQPWHGGKPL
mgnify:CR=1 FL=1